MNRRLSTLLTVVSMTLAGSALSMGSSIAAAPVGSSAAAPAAPAAHQSGVVVIDQDHHSVVLLPLNGRAARTVASGLADPVGIVVDRMANVYILDGGSHRLLRVNLLNGAHAVVRWNVSSSATMAVDDHNNLYVLDGTSVLRYSNWARTKTWLGRAAVGGQLTVDGAGHVTVSSPLLNDFDDGILIQTFPLNGGVPSARQIGPTPSPGGGLLLTGYFLHAVESRDGTLFYELGISGASGATVLDRVPPASKAHVDINTRFAEYAYTVDRRGNFYLMQNRKWCPSPARNNPVDPCVDDYSVDSILKYAPAAATPTSRPVHNLKLPAGGISVDDAGNIFAAVLVSDSATPANDDAVPELVRIGAGSSSPTVLAKGHFSMPQALAFCVS